MSAGGEAAAVVVAAVEAVKAAVTRKLRGA
jgi:hypothetical protein